MSKLKKKWSMFLVSCFLYKLQIQVTLFLLTSIFSSIGLPFLVASIQSLLPQVTVTHPDIVVTFPSTITNSPNVYIQTNCPGYKIIEFLLSEISCQHASQSKNSAPIFHQPTRSTLKHHLLSYAQCINNN